MAIAEAVHEAGSPRLTVVDAERAFGGYTGHTSSCGDTGRPTPWINSVRFDTSAAARIAANVARNRGASYPRFKTDLFDVYSASFHPTALSLCHQGF